MYTRFSPAYPSCPRHTERVSSRGRAAPSPAPSLTLSTPYTISLRETVEYSNSVGERAINESTTVPFRVSLSASLIPFLFGK